jgi:glycolate oxidase FAD binding subunit
VTASQHTPRTFEEVGTSLAAASGEGLTVRTRGGGTKLGWGIATRAPDIELSTAGLDRIVEHNVGDLTAVLEAGVPLAHAQHEFAQAGQMLALDPPTGDGAATIGGIVATADSGPLRHRYGGPRDVLLGITVALADGTIARAGGKVIKNVAGYDLQKLFAGSFGTLGTILSVSVRLHPLAAQTHTALGATSDPDAMSAACRALAASGLELDALDVAWRSGRGGVLARCAGSRSAQRARRAAATMVDKGLERVDVTAEDEALWARQRSGQRSAAGALVRVVARPTELPWIVLATVACGGTLVGRAGAGISYIEVEPDAEAVATLRSALPEAAHAVLLDAPAEVRAAIDPWGVQETPALMLMRGVKARFDPAGTCNPGVFAGGI